MVVCIGMLFKYLPSDESTDLCLMKFLHFPVAKLTAYCRAMITINLPT